MPDGNEEKVWLKNITEVEDPRAAWARAADTTKLQHNYSADDGSGNDWKAGTDNYRMALQAMTPGQSVVSFYRFFNNVLETLLRLNKNSKTNQVL